MTFREQDKEWGKIAVTRQFFALSESFAKWETHLAIVYFYKSGLQIVS